MITREVDVKRVLDIARALSNTARSVLDQPLGPEEQCLTPRQFVKCLNEGVSRQQIEHLFSCENCRQTLLHLTAVRLKSGQEVVVEALREVEGRNVDRPPFDAVRDFMKHFFQRRPPVPALIALDSFIFRVKDPRAKDLTLTCDLMPIIEPRLLSQIKLDSLRLGGAIVATEILSDKLIDVNKDGQPDLLRITFTRGHLAPRVQRAIWHRQPLVDTISLTGKLEGQSVNFLGQARLEFRGEE